MIFHLPPSIVIKGDGDEAAISAAPTRRVRPSSLGDFQFVEPSNVIPAWQRLTETLGITYPIFCGAMFPWTNKELVAAVASAGGMGVIQPNSFMSTYRGGYSSNYQDDYIEDLNFIKQQTDNPFGVNIDLFSFGKSGNIMPERYRRRYRSFLDISLEEGCKFFVTCLGKPDWVVRKAREGKGVQVFHKVTDAKFAKIALDCGVDGLIIVNSAAGGHRAVVEQSDGEEPVKEPTARNLYEEIREIAGDKHLICAGGISTPEGFQEALEIGYSAIMMGTRFQVSKECGADPTHKKVIIDKGINDLCLTKRVDSVPLSVVKTDNVKEDLPPLVQKLSELRKRYRIFNLPYQVSRIVMLIFGLKKLVASVEEGNSSAAYVQAGDGIEWIKDEKTCEEIIQELATVL